MTAQQPIRAAEAQMPPPAASDMVRALEAALAASQRLDDGHATLGECLGILMDEIGAGTPRYEALGDMRAEAMWWADTATPEELETYTAAALRRIERVRFAEATRKRLLVALWDSLDGAGRSAFLAKVIPAPIAAREGDVVAAVKATVRVSDYDLRRAEGRAAFDRALRAAIARHCGADKEFARHVGDMIAEWRRGLLWPKPP